MLVYNYSNLYSNVPNAVFMTFVMLFVVIFSNKRLCRLYAFYLHEKVTFYDFLRTAQRKYSAVKGWFYYISLIVNRSLWSHVYDFALLSNIWRKSSAIIHVTTAILNTQLLQALILLYNLKNNPLITAFYLIFRDLCTILRRFIELVNVVPEQSIADADFRLNNNMF